MGQRCVVEQTQPSCWLHCAQFDGLMACYGVGIGCLNHAGSLVYYLSAEGLCYLHMPPTITLLVQTISPRQPMR